METNTGLFFAGYEMNRLNMQVDVFSFTYIVLNHK